MIERPITDLSIDQRPNGLGSEGYDLWFDLPPKPGDATTPEFQTLCQGAILVGRIAQAMGWEWSTLVRHIHHLSAPMDGYLIMEVGGRLFNASAFRRALAEGVPDSGLDPYKVKVVDVENASVHILGYGLPPI